VSNASWVINRHCQVAESIRLCGGLFLIPNRSVEFLCSLGCCINSRNISEATGETHCQGIGLDLDRFPALNHLIGSVFPVLMES
jgi:hypothetical protein